MAGKGLDVHKLVQLALDFFDPPAAAPQPARAEVFAPNKPPAPASSAQGAPENIATAPPPPAPPAVPLPSLLAPAEFRHPRANREVLLGEAVVAYALQRARRRSIGFTVGPDGLSVRAPSWVTLSGVDAALREKSGWILRKLSEARERQQRVEGGRIEWTDGAELPYLGAPLRVVLDPSHGFSGKGGALVPAAGPAGQGEGGSSGTTGSTALCLHIGLPRSAGPAQIRDAVQAWLMRDARRHFTARLEHFAPLLGVRWTSLRLSNANTRWGSAKADGSIRLNWRLLHYPPAIIDYVVAHELAHLRVMDHSPRFWDTVATVVPDYAALRDHLRDEPAPLW